MKLVNYKTNKMRFFALLILCFSAVQTFGQSKAQDNDSFYHNLVKVQPEMSKEEVKAILGTPYKISFELTEQGDLIESIYYKTEIKTGKWSIIIYQCVFKNSVLVALIQKEYFWETSNNSVQTPL